MAETVNSLRVQVIISGNTVGDDGAKQRTLFSYDRTMSNGTGTDGVGNVWQDLTRSLDTTTEDLDFGTGGLADFQGVDLVLGDAKVILMLNESTTTTQNLKFTQGAVNPALTVLEGTTPKVVIGPAGLMLLVNPIDGYALTDGSADTLGAETVATSTYEAIVAGKNA